jgi:nucleoside-diphosphate-sugar epimerase
MKRKTVLVTGATGLLGKQILIQLLARDYTIYAVKRASSLIPLNNKKIQWIEIKSIKNNVLEQISNKIDFVIHAGAMVSYKKSDEEKIYKVNTNWTYHLAKDAKEAGVKKFIFISSISALGKNSANHKIDESTPKTENEFLTNYGKSKRKAEEYLWKLSKEGLPIIIFNPSVIIGPAKRYQSSAQLFAYVGDQKPFYTQGLINYIDVRDVAEIIIQSLEHKSINEQFILNAGSISYQEFFGKIAEKLKVKAPKIGVPKFLVILGAILENIFSKIINKPPTLTMETAKMAGNRTIYMADKANKTFNIRYKSFEESVEWTVSEMQKSGEL